MEKAAKRIKILYFITKANWGGAQRYVHDLATHLNREEFEIIVVSQPGTLLEKVKRSEIRVYEIEELERNVHILKEIAVARTFARILKAERPDIVHLNSSKAGGLGALISRLRAVPVILFTVHGWAFNEDRPWYERQIIRFISWITLLLCHQVIAVSHYDYEQGAALPLSLGRIITIHNGCEPVIQTDKASARARLVPHARSLPPLWIGTIGELHRNKGIDVAIRAISQIVKAGIPLTYVVVGEGEERAALEALIRETGLKDSVHLVGFKPNAPELLAAFDIFALPARKEGLSYVLLEAGYAGIATVATTVGGIPEILIENVTGKLVPPNNPTMLAEALQDMLQNTSYRALLGKALAQSTQTQFSLDRMLEETAALYRAQHSLHS